MAKKQFVKFNNPGDVTRMTQSGKSRTGCDDTPTNQSIHLGFFDLSH